MHWISGWSCMYCNTIDTIQKSDYLQFTFQKPNETSKSFLKHGYEVTHYSDNKSTNTTISYLNFLWKQGENNEVFLWFSWRHKWMKSSKNNFQQGRNLKLCHRQENGKDWIMLPESSLDFSKFTLRKCFFLFFKEP